MWFSVSEGSIEEEAIKAIKADFEEKFQGVTVELVAIPDDDYADKIKSVAANGELPTLFESTDIDSSILEGTTELGNVIESEQFKNSLFLDDYDEYYKDNKKVPLVTEVRLHM